MYFTTVNISAVRCYTQATDYVVRHIDWQSHFLALFVCIAYRDKWFSNKHFQTKRWRYKFERESPSDRLYAQRRWTNTGVTQNTKYGSAPMMYSGSTDSRIICTIVDYRYIKGADTFVVWVTPVLIPRWGLCEKGWLPTVWYETCFTCMCMT